MTKNPNLFRPALTAIAAVLASTPLTVSAQTAPSDTAAPPTMTSPIATPVVQPVITIDPVATTAPTPNPRSTIAPEALRQVADEAIADAMEAPAPRGERAAKAATPRAAVAPRRVAETASIASPVIDSTVAPATIDQPAVAGAPLATEDVAATPAPVVQPTIATNDNALVTGGLIGLGILGVGGLAFAMRRRRSGDTLPVGQDYEPELRVEAIPQPVTYVAPATAAVAAPTLALSTRSGQSTGGSHVERAMRGPTPDNPFLTLRKRLARARFLDKREQSGGSRTGFGSFQPALA